MFTTFLLLAAQNQAPVNGTLSVGQSQFLLGVVARARSALTRASLQSAGGGNRNIIVGNLGAVRTGAQDANPLNVR